MTEEDHLGPRHSEAELQRTSWSVEAVNKDDIIWRLTKKYGVTEKLESHSVLNYMMSPFSSQNSPSPGFFLITLTLPSYRYFSGIYSKYSNAASSLGSVH